MLEYFLLRVLVSHNPSILMSRDKTTHDDVCCLNLLSQDMTYP